VCAGNKGITAFLIIIIIKKVKLENCVTKLKLNFLLATEKSSQLRDSLKAHA